MEKNVRVLWEGGPLGFTLRLIQIVYSLTTTYRTFHQIISGHYEGGWDGSNVELTWEKLGKQNQILPEIWNI